MSLRLLASRLLLLALAVLLVNLVIDQTHVKPLYYLWYLGFALLGVASLGLITGRFYLALVLYFLPVLLIIVIDKLKFAVLQDHFRWFDLTFLGMAFGSWSTAADFLAGYLTPANLLGLALGLAALLAGGWLLIRLERPLFEPAGWRRRLLRQGLGATGVVAVLIAMPHSAAPMLEAHGKALFWPQAHYRYGSLLFFLGSKRDLATRPDELTPPATSARLIIDRIAAAPPPAAVPAQPDIVIWINESTFDLAELARASGAGPKVRQHRFALFTPQPETIATGPLAVSVFGGNSWTTEFALQAGARSEWFGVHASYTTVALAPYVEHTLFHALRAAGYRTSVLYGFNGAYFGERQAYEHYGVQDFDDPKSLRPTAAGDDLAVLQDQELADALQARLGSPSAQPRCILVFTMANHGPYGERGRRGASFQVTPAMTAFWGPDLPFGLYDYLDRFQETDRVVNALQRQLMARQRPTLFLHLGDHKPSLPEVAFAKAERFQSYYHLLANFPLPPGSQDLRSRRQNDVMFLPGQLLALAVGPTEPLFQANRVLGQACPGSFPACQRQQARLAESYQALAMRNFDFRWPASSQQQARLGGRP